MSARPDRTDLVRVRDGKWEFNRGRAFAEANGLQILEGDPTHRPDGTVRPTTRAGGRRVKPRTTVDAEAKKKRSGSSSKTSARTTPQTSTSDSADVPQDAGVADVASTADEPADDSTTREPTQKE